MWFIKKVCIPSLVFIFSKNFSCKTKLNLKMKNKNNIQMPIYLPQTYNQELYVKYLKDPLTPIVVGAGPAGSGKTLFACINAMEELKKGNVQKIILTRPVVSVEEDIGYLPGSLVAKMEPWTKPIFDIFYEYYSMKDISYMISSGVIEISPLAFMRGRTFKKSFIIADEMQNSSPNQMLMLTTRIGDNSKMVITGDLNQSDKSLNNGLHDFIQKVELYNKKDLSTKTNIEIIQFNSTDIKRSEIVSKIIDIYQFKPLPVVYIKKVNDEIKKNDDAAMIPKYQMTRSHDVFLKNELDF